MSFLLFLSIWFHFYVSTKTCFASVNDYLHTDFYIFYYLEKMPVAKKFTKKPSVVVETKKMSGECCGMKSPCKMGHLWIVILLILNVLLSVCVLCRQTKIEADRVGGRANYQLVKKIYNSQAFKDQQKTSLEQAIQMYQGTAAATTTSPTTALPTATK